MTEAGYFIEQNIFSAIECETIIETLKRNLLVRGRAGSRHLMNNPTVQAIASDKRMLELATGLLGSTAIPYRATLFEKSRQANWLVVWHQDTALPLENYFESQEWGPWSKKAGINYAHAPTWALERIIALRLHLDESTGENGPLKIIPGSHQLGVLTDAEVFEIAHRGNEVSCLVARGGVMAMRPLLIHSSSKADSAAPRRILHIEYSDSLTLAENIHLAIA